MKRRCSFKGKSALSLSRDTISESSLHILAPELEQLLDIDQIRSTARKVGFMKRSSKLTAEHFLECLMFANTEDGQLSLQGACNDMVLHSGVRVSKVALHKRFNNSSVEFVRSVLAHQMLSKMNFVDNRDWSAFSAVILSDSCKFQLPKGFSEAYPPMGGFAGGNPLMNIQYALDIKSGSWKTLDFTQATENDQGYSGAHVDCINKGELHIRDLGYVTHRYLSGVVERQAYFLNRLHTSCRPVETETGKPINWSEKYLSMATKRQNITEISVAIGKGDETIKCRLIAVPVPRAVWQERIRKANVQAKRQRYILTNEYKNRARFSLFITNVENDKLETELVAELYRLRWQVELMFKNWKSLYRIHKVKAVKRERLECQLLAKLLRIVINWKIYKCIDSIVLQKFKDQSCSTWKVFKHLIAITEVIRAMVKKEMTVLQWYYRYISPIITSLLLEAKKGKKSAFQMLNEIFKA